MPQPELWQKTKVVHAWDEASELLSGPAHSEDAARDGLALHTNLSARSIRMIVKTVAEMQSMVDRLEQSIQNY